MNEYIINFKGYIKTINGDVPVEGEYVAIAKSEEEARRIALEDLGKKDFWQEEVEEIEVEISEVVKI